MPKTGEETVDSTAVAGLPKDMEVLLIRMQKQNILKAPRMMMKKRKKSSADCAIFQGSTI